MKGLKAIYWCFMLLLSGVIAAKLTIPLLASWFGVQITITGATAVVGMYMYVLASCIVSVGILAGIAVIVGLFFLVAYLGAASFDYLNGRKSK